MKNVYYDAGRIIKSTTFMVIATSTRNGKPWTTPVFFGYDRKCNLYWISAKNSLHSRLIKENNRVAVSIFSQDSPKECVYIEGKASEIPKKEMQHAVNVIYTRHSKYNTFGVTGRIRTSEDFTGSSPRRLYRLVPEKAWVLAPPEKIKGHHVDARKEIQLGDIIL